MISVLEMAKIGQILCASNLSTTREQSDQRDPATRRYAIKRIAFFVPTVLLLAIIDFVLMSVIPGDPALVILSDGEGSYTQQEMDDLRHELGAPTDPSPSSMSIGLGACSKAISATRCGSTPR